ncbi:MAG TPA: enoyl-CoA hydratase-related protein [Kineosporiaceae bacterium]
MDLTDRGLVLRLPVAGDDGGAVIDDTLVARLSRGLDHAEDDERCRIVLLSSPLAGVFSTGMNLVGAARAEDAGQATRRTGAAFFDLLERFTRTPRIVVSLVEGQVAGGGLGLVAASDLVLSGERSSFALPEALWGLLPCVVLPFLARRVGFQKAYSLALTTQPIDAGGALACGLADDVRADPGQAVRQLAYRAARLDPATIGDLKRYAHRMNPLPADTRAAALTELGRLLAEPPVRRRLAAFADHGRYPWES